MRPHQDAWGVGASDVRNMDYAHEAEAKSPLFARETSEFDVWMRHGDKVATLPPVTVAARSLPCPYVAIQHQAKKFYTLHFHPEIIYTQHGEKIFKNFLFSICGCSGEWDLASWTEEAIEKLKTQVGQEHVVLGLSGGVDSSVVAVLLHRAIGDRLHCIFVDHGLLRAGEDMQVERCSARRRGLHLVYARSASMPRSRA